MRMGLHLLLLLFLVLDINSSQAGDHHEFVGESGFPLFRSYDYGNYDVPGLGYKNHSRVKRQRPGYPGSHIDSDSARKNTVGPAMGPNRLSRYWYRFPHQGPVATPSRPLNRWHAPSIHCQESINAIRLNPRPGFK